MLTWAVVWLYKSVVAKGDEPNGLHLFFAICGDVAIFVAISECFKG